ncbi:hypothetical protein V1498_08635 [Peribacillus sp. SCS-26]|uniref:hypothetical protein n=1 Tax=Paraperibacillus marinus TaxID=3115295 RepID=UPI0039065483
MAEHTYEELLNSYLSIWKNRAAGQAPVTNQEEMLLELIKRELLDENSHPRIRKKKEEKFVSSLVRLSESQLSLAEKGSLLGVYTKVYKELL